jgi:hypothetical protein
MNSELVSNKSSAARIVASFFGVLAGLGGLTHGVGEVLQGNTAPEGIAINSWTQGPIATNMGGEPGVTIIPNLLLTGVLTILIALAAIVWAAFYVRRKNGGRILIALSAAMLLTGGGIGPPLIGILAGAAGSQIGKPLSGWRSRFSRGTRRFLAALWSLFFAAAAIGGLFLVVGSLILVFFFGVNNAAFFLNTFYVTVLSLLLTVLTAPFYDDARGSRQVVPRLVESR